MDASNLSELRDAAVDYAKQQQNQHDGEPQFLELRSGISRLSSPESGLVAEAKRFAPPHSFIHAVAIVNVDSGSCSLIDWNKRNVSTVRSSKRWFLRR